jgi:hypothetical protein
MTMQPRVKLSAILDVIDEQFEEMCVYFDKQTGKIFVLTEEDRFAAADDDEGVDYPDWRRESIEQVKAVLSDEESDGGRFLPLPDRFDINEWDMMRDFATNQENEDHADMLLHAIHGKGAFRYFRDRIHELNLADAWNTFRDDQYRQIAMDWCETHGINVDVNA